MRKRESTVTTIDPSHLQCLTVPEVAKLLGVGRTTVYQLLGAGAIQSVKIGSAKRVLVLSVREYIQKQIS